ncbi:MAG TPA: EAL domain-containing protein [Thermoanaerobaculia bacterium]|jgi:diguanylate cyclase (GGDEF)-like protein/PAS domain S-box-containing protein|nr:EAL domain-containing protein [Thermoanaerobaculia bacterium]
MRSEILDPTSYAFNAYAIPLLATMVAMLLLGIFVLFRERGSREAVHFSLLAGSISIWLICFSFMYLAAVERVALIWARSAYLGICLIPGALYGFAVAVTHSRRRWLVRAGWLLSIAFALASAGTGALVRDLYHYWWGFYPRFRGLGVPFLAFFFIMLALSFREYWLDYRRSSPGIHSLRTRSLMTGFAVAYLGSFDYVAAYGVPLYPFGYLAVLAFIVIAARTIRRYLLVDLTPAFAAEQILATVADPVIVCDSGGIIRFTNHAASTVFGYEPGELAGAPIELLAEPCMGSSVLLLVSAGEVVRDAEMVFRARQGERIEVGVSLSPLADDRGVGVGAVLVVRDIRARKRAESQIAYQACHDALTGLPNRMLFYDRLTQGLARAKRHGDRLAVLFLDLDQFKVVNDSLGHAAGDRLLIEIAGRLQRTLRQGDTVARVGGDEFTFLLPGIERGEDASRVAQKILEAVSRPLEIDGHQLYVTPSIGISLYPTDGEDAEALLSSADIAMYRAKDQGRNGIQISSPAMNARSVARLSLERDLRMAIERGEFTLVYQPQAGVLSGRTVGVEALLRWNHPRRGVVLPGEFIAIAEETRLILPLGEWVLRTACEQARQWRKGGGSALRVAVNLSALQFRQRNLARTVQTVLSESGIPPGSLELEITESAAMHDAGMTIGVLSELREMGVRIALDDFGTGHASLSYLKRFPLDTLKIDRSFVWGIENSRQDTAIIAAITGLAHGLGLAVLAEGVESESQLGLLAACGCDEYQGFLLSKPLAPAVVSDLLGGSRRTAVLPLPPS